MNRRPRRRLMMSHNQRRTRTRAAGLMMNMLDSCEVWSCSGRSGAKLPMLFSLERPYK